MATSAIGKRTHREKGYSPPLTRSKKTRGDTDFLHCLPRELWIKIFIILFPNKEFAPLRKTCTFFRNITLEAIHTYYNEKKEVNGEDLLHLRLPLFYLLIYRAKEFQKFKPEKNRWKKQWEDYSYPELTSYALFHCKNLKVLDLRHKKYSLSTFIGDPEPFNHWEVATLSTEENETDVQKAAEAMQKTFALAYPFSKVLPNVEKLKFDYSPEFKKDFFKKCAKIFSNLKAIEVYNGKFDLCELQKVLGQFKFLESCSLHNCTLQLSNTTSNFFFRRKNGTSICLKTEND